MKNFFYAILMALMFTAPTFATITVTSPTNDDTVGSPARFIATANADGCSNGVASMGIYINNELKYVVTGDKLDTTLPLAPGIYNNIVLQEWDGCGGATYVREAIKVTDQTGVFVTTPLPNSTVNSVAKFAATASTNVCPQGVSSMGIYVNNVRKYVVPGAKLNTQLSLNAGTQHAVVQEWDYCGGSATTPVDLNVQISSPPPSYAKTFHNLQASNEWMSWGQVAPNFVDCSPSPCESIQWSHSLGVQSPSLSGNATQFTLGGPDGTAKYGDVLFTLPLIGVGSSQGLPDYDHTLLPTLHNFIYDADFYVTNTSITQALEFDVSQWISGTAGMTFGTQCNYLGDRDWDIWNNQTGHWVSSGVPCKLVNGWNHVTIQLQRLADNSTLYKSIALNGTINQVNVSYPDTTAPAGWWGLNVNFQMDGDYKESPNVTYLDNVSLTYW